MIRDIWSFSGHIRKNCALRLLIDATVSILCLKVQSIYSIPYFLLFSWFSYCGLMNKLETGRSKLWIHSNLIDITTQRYSYLGV